MSLLPVLLKLLPLLAKLLPLVLPLPLPPPADELRALLEKLQYRRGVDLLLAVGDLVNKGPDSEQVGAAGGCCARRALRNGQVLLQAGAAYWAGAAPGGRCIMGRCCASWAPVPVRVPALGWAGLGWMLSSRFPLLSLSPPLCSVVPPARVGGWAVHAGAEDSL